MRAYRKKNRNKISKQVQDWKDNNREYYKKYNREYYATDKGKRKHIMRSEKTPRVWLGRLLSRMKTSSEKPGPHDPKSGPRCDFDIDLDYVMEIFDAQGGKCALTGVALLHEYNNMASASIDRIDSSKGHVKGNIQIICQCINRMKNKHSNAETIAMLDKMFEARSYDLLPFAQRRQIAKELMQPILNQAERQRRMIDAVANMDIKHATGAEIVKANSEAKIEHYKKKGK